MKYSALPQNQFRHLNTNFIIIAGLIKSLETLERNVAKEQIQKFEIGKL